MTSLLRFAYVMAIRRAVSGWRLEAVLFGSILLAVSLLASGVIFSDLLANAALREALAVAEPEDVNFRVRSFSSRDDPADIEGRRLAFQSRKEFVERQVADVFRPYLREHSRLLETATFYFQGHPQLELDRDSRPRGSITHLDGIAQRVQVLEGQLPEGPGEPGQPVDVAVDRLGSELLQLGVGQTMEVIPATASDDPSPLEVRIAAVFEPTDRADEFWYGIATALSRKDDRWTLVPLHASEDALIDRVLGTYPQLYTDTTWHFFPDRLILKADEIEEVQTSLARIESSVATGLKNSSQSIRLDSLLRSFEERLLLARLPMLLILFLVTGVLVYYLSLVAGLIVRSRSVEIAMLKSRGATTWQLGFLGLGEGLLLAVPAVIAGPFVALGVVKILGVIFFQLSGSDSGLAGVPAGISLNAYLVGAVGGGLAVIVFTAASLAAAGRGGKESRQASARPPVTTLLHRYYLDVALLAVIGLVWWQLQSRGTFLVQSLDTRELTIDYSLLLGPALGLAAAGLIVLRLFPWAAVLLSRLAEPVAPAWLMHVLRHLGRDPMTPALLVVLVMLATALGVMGSAFTATLERGQQERALYEAGADLRLKYGGVERAGAESGVARWRGDAGDLLASADALRTPVYLTTTGFSTSGMLLAVDADTLADVSWFRDDFAGGRPLDELLESLKVDQSGELLNRQMEGIALPADATELVLWARPGGSAQFVGIWARLRDSKGLAADALVGEVRDTQWSRLALDLSTVGQSRSRILGAPPPPSPDFTPPYELVSLRVESRLRENDGGAIFLGRIDATTPQGNTLVHDFRSTEGWTVIEDFGKPGLYSLETGTAAAEGEFDVTSRFGWASGGVGLKGIRTGGPYEPIPALVSSEFLEVADVEVGDTVILGMTTHALLLHVAAEVDLFPTLDPQDRPFAIVDITRFNEATLLYSPRPTRGANELWLSGRGTSIDQEAVLASLREDGIAVREVLNGPEMVTQRLEQPLVNAGWGALLVLMFLAVALASASGLMLFSHLDARERQTEFALLRTLGTSRGQMQSVVWASLFVLVACGVGIGTLLGWLIGSSLLPLMEVVEEGTRVTPSLVFTTDWQRLLVSYGILALVTCLSGLWLTWLTGKLRLHQVLRMGE